MPGLDYNEYPHSPAATPAATAGTAAPMAVDAVDPGYKASVTPDSAVYYNPRLDPANYLEGPLSHNPATRLRQMLARPGIVVRGGRYICLPMSLTTDVGRSWYLRWYLRALCHGSWIRLPVPEVT